MSDTATTQPLALTYQPKATIKAETFDPTELRRQRGLAIAALCRIVEKKGEWFVPSQTGNGKYQVQPDESAPKCTCPDFEERGQPCKHVFAVRFVIGREPRKGRPPTIPPERAAELTKQSCPKRPTYKQAWPAYNQAQTNEKAKFQELLHDLCRGVVSPPRKPGGGRNPVPLSDLVFAAVFKVYSTFSGRRFQTDLDDAVAKGYLSRPVRYNTVLEGLDGTALTPILHALIARSAAPLRSLELDFAVDSSGFATSRFVRWFDHKYGCPRQQYDWVKVHVMTGVRTNVVTAVEIGDAYAADSPQFAPLVRTTAKGFTLRDVSADKAYLSYENMDVVAELGGTPYIAIRENTSARKGGTLARMFHLYNLNREDFLSHYHRRSNVESTFSMIKAKFGDSLRSKTDRAMENEALCKILGHNLCCLIQSTYEFGVAVEFWGEEEGSEPEREPVAASDIIDVMAWM